jgi:hypothetical protein
MKIMALESYMPLDRLLEIKAILHNYPNVVRVRTSDSQIPTLVVLIQSSNGKNVHRSLVFCAAFMRLTIYQQTLEYTLKNEEIIEKLIS